MGVSIYLEIIVELYNIKEKRINGKHWHNLDLFFFSRWNATRSRVFVCIDYSSSSL